MPTYWMTNSATGAKSLVMLKHKPGKDYRKSAAAPIAQPEPVAEVAVPAIDPKPKHARVNKATIAAAVLASII